MRNSLREEAWQGLDLKGSGDVAHFSWKEETTSRLLEKIFNYFNLVSCPGNFKLPAEESEGRGGAWIIKRRGNEQLKATKINASFWTTLDMAFKNLILLQILSRLPLFRSCCPQVGTPGNTRHGYPALGAPQHIANIIAERRAPMGDIEFL